jgi:hypothetical protein
MDDINLSQQQQDWEALKRAEPEWKSAQIEPFLTTPQDDVTRADWTKLRMDQNSLMGTGASSSDGGSSSFVGLVVANGVGRYASINGTLLGEI